MTDSKHKDYWDVSVTKIEEVKNIVENLIMKDINNPHADESLIKKQWNDALLYMKYLIETNAVKPRKASFMIQIWTYLETYNDKWFSRR
jgi:hypothetical protein